jgi:hypothetical protein
MFGDNPSELSSMISGPRSRTDIFDGADLRQAAGEFLAVDWTSISSTIDDTLQEVSDKLQERRMDKLLSQWREYISHIAPILAKRHKAIVLHAKHILES